ncbi:MAG: Holliday junction branch migration protein RuvA [Clostridia bacterium]|nr:Holliday junction branch migration protein RuvA [Clostridia bacterium]
MIRYIKGKLVESLDKKIVVENESGIGFEINIPAASSLYKVEIGDDIKIFTYMKVSEDDISLFGFEDRENLQMFEMLIKVGGVGPKGAISILSELPLPELKKAIATSDSKAIARANGIGKKTAEKICIDLQDKFQIDDIDLVSTKVNVPMNGLRGEAVEALVSLGYSKNEAMSAISKIAEDQDSVEDYIKKGLINLF